MKKTNTLPPSSRASAETRYATLREMAFRQTEEIIDQDLGLKIHIQPIGDDDVVIADAWSTESGAEFVAKWRWADVVRHYRSRARRLEAAFYLVDSDEAIVLWGLLVGRFSNGRVTASMHYIARDPLSEVGNFAMVASRYLQLQAVALDCSTISVVRPVPSLVEHYRRLGFTKEIRKRGAIERLEVAVDAITPDVIYGMKGGQQ